MSASTPLDSEKIIGGNAKQAKFDRQLRLWGAEGQAALEAAHVVALGATPAIAEALKSLVLTGVPSVTLVDERVVTAEDASTNYFVAASSLGTSLATAVLQNVCVLGEQCTGMAATVTPQAWVTAYAAAVERDWRAGCLYSSPVTAGGPGGMPSGASPSSSPLPADGASAVRDFMKDVTLVESDDASAVPACEPHVAVAAPTLILVSERYADLSALSPLVQTCLQRSHPDVPVVLVRSSGFLGFVQVYCPPRLILRPHNPTQVKMEDLRIFEPFPALRAWFNDHNPDDDAQFPATDTDAMSLHSHLPYPCIIHYAYRRWWSAMSSEEQHAMLHRHAPPPPPSSPSTSSVASIFPLSAKDYRDIGNLVAGMIRRQSPPEDAFIEAMEKCTAKLNRPVVQQLPEGLQALFQDPRCADPLLAVTELRARLAPAAETPSAELSLLIWTSPEVLVWFITRAVQLFVMGEIGREEAPQGGAPLCVSRYHIPFSGYLPDFTTTTMWYRELQDLYHAKHLADVTCIVEKALDLVLAAVASSEETTTRQNEEGADGSARDAQRLQGPLRATLGPLLTKYTTTMVANIWDLRKVVFSAGYGATQEVEWRQRLGRRLTWIAHNILYDVTWNATTRRAACLAIAHLCKEELQRRDDVQRAPTGQEIAAEVAQLAALAGTVTPVPHAAGGEDGSDAASEATDSFPAWFVEESAPQKLLPKACEEVARWAGRGGSDRGSVQLPSVAASTGALAAQESVKLIMRIRVPCGQPIMYDGYTNKVFTL